MQPISITTNNRQAEKHQKQQRQRPLSALREGCNIQNGTNVAAFSCNRGSMDLPSRISLCPALAQSGTEQHSPILPFATITVFPPFDKLKACHKVGCLIKVIGGEIESCEPDRSFVFRVCTLLGIMWVAANPQFDGCRSAQWG